MSPADLEKAYQLRTPEDSRKLYAQWARDYDSAFAGALDYQLPFSVAQTFAGLGGQGPVLDVGAGTGLAARALHEQGLTEIDGTDISPEMLAVAQSKSLYRNVFTADLTKGLPVPDGAYRGVISSGTFTLGHVGPDALAEVFRVVAPGGLGVISVSRAHYTSAAFDVFIADLPNSIWVAEIEVPIYGPDHDGPHAGDTAVLICAHVR